MPIDPKTPYSSNGIHLVKPMPPADTAFGLFLGNDKALSDAIDAIKAKLADLKPPTPTAPVHQQLAERIGQRFGLTENVTTVAYGDNGVYIMNPAPASGSGGALLMNNFMALSAAIDAKGGSTTFNGYTLTLSGNTTLGSSTNTLALLTTGNTSVTLPTSGTLATTSQLGTYLPLSGGTLTGALSLNANSSLNFTTGGRVISDGNSGVIVEYQNGVHSLYVSSSGLLTSGGNVLDDGNGNTTISGLLNTASLAVNGYNVSLNGNLTINGNLSLTGLHNTTFAQTATTTLTLPSSSGTLATTANLSSYAPLSSPVFTTTYTNTSGSSASVSITPIYNQTSGTAANTDLLINRTETAVGSGNQLLIDSQVGGTSVFSVNHTGLVLTSGSVNSPKYTGQYSNTSIVYGPTNTSISTANFVANQFTTGTSTATSGTNIGLAITPIYNQTSGTAANTDLLINRTQTAKGSGTQRLIDAQVGGTSKFNVDNSGNVTIAGTLTGSSGGNSNLTIIKGMSISGSTVIASGVIGSVAIPFNAYVTNWAVISTDGTTGSIAFDILTVASGSLVPNSTTNATSIVSTGVKPSLSSSAYAHSIPLSWSTTSLTGGTYLIFSVYGTPSTVENVRIELTLTPR